MAILLLQKQTAAEITGTEDNPYEDMEQALNRLKVLEDSGLIDEYKFLRRRAMGG